MGQQPLSFEVLGLIAPILTWAESSHGRRMPAAWTSDGSIDFKHRERNWLLSELSSYSYDNVADVVAGTRQDHDRTMPGLQPWQHAHQPAPSLSPPSDYDLLLALRSLHRRFFVWNGTELCIQKGRMEELHELAIRWPAGHIVRYGHARAIMEGTLSFRDALALPEIVTLLPTNSFGLRNVARRGLSESHLHMTAVLSAEENWANNLLRPLSSGALHGRDEGDQRLLTLNLLSGRMLALAVWFSEIELDQEDCQYVFPYAHRLLALLDRIYFARSAAEEHHAVNRFRLEFRSFVQGIPWRKGGGQEPTETQAGQEFAALSRLRIARWIAPTAFRLGFLLKGSKQPLERSQEGARERLRFVHELHLQALVRLLALSPLSSGSPRHQLQADWASTNPQRRFLLHEAFFRYLVCRTHQWQQATQQGRTTGLRHFSEFYRSDSRKVSSLTELQYTELVFERLRQWNGLRVVEGRIGPPKRAEDVVPWILAFARPKDRRIEKFGLVVHFKKRDEAQEEKSFSRASNLPTLRLRWGQRRRMIRNEGMALYRMLRRPTPVTPFIVGIDACSLELATPPEVFAPVFRFLRDLPISPKEEHRFAPYAKLDEHIRKVVGKRRLGMTYHVGEDFRFLLSGLRAIDEVIRFLKPSPGDRLGHGTALALRPEDWLEHNGYQAIMSKIELLDTLVWVRQFLGAGDSIIGELAIEDRIQRLSWEIYSDAISSHYDPMALDNLQAQNSSSPVPRGRSNRGLLDWDWSPLTLWDAWYLRQLDPYSVDINALLHGSLKARPAIGPSEENRRWFSVQETIIRDVRKKVGSRNAYLLLGLYWLSPKVRREGSKVIVHDMQDQKQLWLELCRRTETKMKHQVYERELVVEVNPSSNRIIGPMSRYGQHHIFELTLDENRRLERSVRVSINTDNPAVCNTTLAHEYYLLGEILMDEGVPEAEVVKWLEWLRKNGEDYNFVKSLKASSKDNSMAEIINWLRGVRPSVLEASNRQAKLKAFWNWGWKRETQRDGETGPEFAF